MAARRLFYAEYARIAEMVREFFNVRPRGPVSGLTQAVLSLAKDAYEHRILQAGTLDAARVSMLADALEDAGCGDAELLGHLRSPLHWRGCWAIDLLLNYA